jgi:hypothetical protein
MEPEPHLGNNASDLFPGHDQIIDPLLEHLQVWLVLDPISDGLFIEQAIGLGPCCPNCRTFPRIQDTKLDTATICRMGHGAAERIDLFDQVPLADATDGRVAAHLTYGLNIMSQQKGARTHARSRKSGLGSGMATAYDDDVK